MPFSAALLFALLSSVSLLTRLEKVTGSAVADHSKRLEEIDSVPNHLQDASPKEEGLQLKDSLWVSNTRQPDLAAAERPGRDTLQRSSSKWATSKLWESDRGAEGKENGILHEDMTDLKQFGQSKEVREKRITFGEITWRREKPSDYPGYAIGRLGNGCTAFFIGPFQALTAAHCVYSRSTRQWTKWALDIESQSDCKRPTHAGLFKKEWVSAHVHQRYIQSGYQYEDVALIVTRLNPVCYDRKPCLQLAEYPPDCTNATNISIYGYPLHPRNQVWHPKLFWPLVCLASSSCNDAECSRYFYGMLSYRCDTAQGMSGSPIIACSGPGDKEECVVHGVHSFGNFYKNYGVKLTAAKLEEIKNLVCSVPAPLYPSFCHKTGSDDDSDKSGDSNADMEHMNSTNATEIEPTMTVTTPTAAPYECVTRSGTS